MCKGLAHGEEERRIIPADSMAANSFLADSSFSASRRRALAKTGGPGDVGTVWRTGCLGSVVKKTFGGDDIRIFGQEITELFRGRKESSIET